MSYDYYITASSDGVPNTAEWVSATTADALPAEFVGFLADISATDPMDEESGWLSMDPWVADQGVVFNTRWSEVEFTRTLVIATASHHGLGVFDPQTSVAFDPQGNVAIFIKTGGGYALPFLSRSTLHNLLEHPEAGSPWLIVERGDHEYAQTVRDADGSFTVEYRDGGPHAHFQYSNADLPLTEQLIWSWCTDGDWRAAVDWTHVDLG